MRWVGVVLIGSLLIAGCRREAEVPPSTEPLSLRIENDTEKSEPMPLDSTPVAPPPSVTPEIPETPDRPAAESPSTLERDLEQGFIRLTLADFLEFTGDSRPEKPLWTERNGRLHYLGPADGYLYSKQSYRNFTLRFRFRYLIADDAPDEQFAGDAGIFCYVTGDPKFWPLGMEVDLQHAVTGRIQESGDAAEAIRDDKPDTRAEVLARLGDWQQIEVVSREGALTAKLNGEVVCTAEPNFLSQGSIGIQSSGAAFEIADLRIREEP